jgi:hypothetical protein
VWVETRPASGLAVPETPWASAPARALADIPAPAGFERIQTCRSGPATAVCFRRVPSIVLNRTKWTALIGSLGINATAAGCRHSSRQFDGESVLLVCEAWGARKGDILALTATSVAKVTPRGYVGTYAAAPGGDSGTRIAVADVGRCARRQWMCTTHR